MHAGAEHRCVSDAEYKRRVLWHQAGQEGGVEARLPLQHSQPPPIPGSGADYMGAHISALGCVPARAGHLGYLLVPAVRHYCLLGAVLVADSLPCQALPRPAWNRTVDSCSNHRHTSDQDRSRVAMAVSSTCSPLGLPKMEGL